MNLFIFFLLSWQHFYISLVVSLWQFIFIPMLSQFVTYLLLCVEHFMKHGFYLLYELQITHNWSLLKFSSMKPHHLFAKILWIGNLGRVICGGVGRTVRRQEVREESPMAVELFPQLLTLRFVSTIKGWATEPGKQPGAPRRPHPVVKDNGELRWESGKIELATLFFFLLSVPSHLLLGAQESWYLFSIG